LVGKFGADKKTKAILSSPNSPARVSYHTTKLAQLIDEIIHANRALHADDGQDEARSERLRVHGRKVQESIIDRVMEMLNDGPKDLDILQVATTNLRRALARSERKQKAREKAKARKEARKLKKAEKKARKKRGVTQKAWRKGEAAIHARAEAQRHLSTIEHVYHDLMTSRRPGDKARACSLFQMIARKERAWKQDHARAEQAYKQCLAQAEQARKRNQRRAEKRVRKRAENRAQKKAEKRQSKRRNVNVDVNIDVNFNPDFYFKDVHLKLYVNLLRIQGREAGLREHIPQIAVYSSEEGINRRTLKE
jgi:hypothetical protein